MKFSALNENLVIKMPDYISGKEIISFIGINKPNLTRSTLLQYAKKDDIRAELRLIPHATATKIDPSKFSVEQDPDNFDYVFSTEKLSKLKGGDFKVKRHLSNRFINKYPKAVFRTSLVSDSASQKQVIELLKVWQNCRNDTVELENIAIYRLLELSKIKQNNLILSGIYMEENLVAFSIDEILSGDYAISHFFKSNNEYSGVSEYINQKSAQFLLKHGVKLWSWEQDLGLSGLRKSKNSYRPVTLLKKYNINNL